LSQAAKIAAGIGAVVLITLIAAVFFLRHLVVKSFPQTDGNINVPGLHSAADVYRDDYGIPHIKAQDDHDLMFTVGYVHAQDRLWQMDLMRRAGEGRLSEIFGPKTLEYDELFRTLNLAGVSDKLMEKLHPDAWGMLQAYADGVNAFIDTHAGKFPIEFDMLRYRPEHWDVRHSLLIGRLIAWDLNLAWWTDLTYGEIAAKVPQDKLDQIIPTYPDSIPTTVHGSGKKGVAAEHRLETPSLSTAISLRDVQDFQDFMAIGRSYREYFGLGPLGGGSNGWVVNGSKSVSGKPLLANDPHLAMPAPSRWYELHLSAPGWNVSGVSLPGAPVVVIGHNDHISWGLTNAMIDDADFYVERLDTTKHGEAYFFEKSSIPFDQRDETIRIGSSDSMTIKVRSSRHGPIVNDVHPMHKHNDQDTLYHRAPLAMRWTGLEVSDEMYGFYLMDRASNRTEFERGLREIAVPGQSVVYADVEGNIGYWTTGHIPIRGNQNAMLPLPGWTGDAEWKGYVPFDDLPRTFNPPEGMIACANQKIADKSFPHYISTLWEPPSRIQRILQLLGSADKFTPEDFKQFQHDEVSLYARDLTGHILHAYDSVKVEDPDVASALAYLRNWDYKFAQSDVVTAIFNSFFVHLIHNTYEDEMGPGLFRDFVFFDAIPYRVTSQLLARDSSSWFDDVRTPEHETKNEIVRKSLADALDELRHSLGNEMKTWRWGVLHTVTFSHPIGSVKPLDRIFNIGPFPIGGGATTVGKTEFRLATPYAVAVGPTLRQVIDMAEPLDADMVITSGESGQPLLTHYNDQSPLWLTGGYYRVTMNWKEIQKSPWDHLTLKPQ
jgi:penicillin amidase